MSPSSDHDRTTGSIGLAIDGGNSKTEVVLLRLADGRAAGSEFARVIAPGSGGGPAEVVAAVVHALAEAGGVSAASVTRVRAAVAGLDFPGDEETYRAGLAALLPNATVEVVNDAVAVLDAAGRGTAPATRRDTAGAATDTAPATTRDTAPATTRHALAIVCGAGLNAVARGPRGRATVPALGWPSGDWGGGDDIGREAVRVAARAEDGRGPRTVLAERIPQVAALPDMSGVGRAIRDGRFTRAQVGALSGVVTQAAAEGDAVAAGIVARAVEEALLLADVVVRGAWGEGWSRDGFATAPPAVLAGGLFADPLFRSGVEDGLRARGFAPAVLAHRPVDGLVAAILDDRAESSS